MNIGEKIRFLRQSKDLTQEELSIRCEVSKGFISQLERDLTSPSLNTLSDILESLGTNLSEFFNFKDDEKILFNEQDFFEAEDENLKFKVEWIVPNAQKNLIEPIILTLYPGGRYKEMCAHQGEEFGYVLLGSVYIHYGSNKIRAKKGDTFSYRANFKHYISNCTKGISKILWITSPPAF